MQIVNITLDIISSITDIHFPFEICSYNEQIYLKTKCNQRYVIAHAYDLPANLTCPVFDHHWDLKHDYKFEVRTTNDLRDALLIGNVMGWWSGNEIQLLRQLISAMDHSLVIVD